MEKLTAITRLSSLTACRHTYNNNLVYFQGTQGNIVIMRGARVVLKEERRR